MHDDSRGTSTKTADQPSRIVFQVVLPGPYAASASTRQRRRGPSGLRVRPFNVAGPGQAHGRVLPRMAEQVARREAGRFEPIMTRDLAGVRDFIDVRDTVMALATLAARGEPGSGYNVWRGHGVRVGDLLEHLLALAGLGDVSVATRGGHGVDVSVGDPARLRQLGWRPRVPLGQTVRDVLEEWRRHVAR